MSCWESGSEGSNEAGERRVPGPETLSTNHIRSNTGVGPTFTLSSASITYTYLYRT
jgi:hypothetical protein